MDHIEQSEIKSWGTSVCLPINRFLQKSCRLSKGTKVQIEVTDDGFFVRPTGPKTKKFGKLDILVVDEELLSGLTEDDFRYGFEEDYERMSLEDFNHD